MNLNQAPNLTDCPMFLYIPLISQSRFWTPNGTRQRCKWWWHEWHGNDTGHQQGFTMGSCQWPRCRSWNWLPSRGFRHGPCVCTCYPISAFFVSIGYGWAAFLARASQTIIDNVMTSVPSTTTKDPNNSPIGSMTWLGTECCCLCFFILPYEGAMTFGTCHFTKVSFKKCFPNWRIHPCERYTYGA